MSEIEHSESIEQNLFWAGSKCIDPACYAHELFRRIQLVDVEDPDTGFMFKLAEKGILFTQLLTYSAVSIVTVPFGLAFRSLAVQLQYQPFLHIEEAREGKILPEAAEFTILSWNICCVGAGYPVSDGGVSPWRDRSVAIADKIIETDADINCIYETFDIDSAFYLHERLKEKGYIDFYFNMGPKTIGAPSGIFVASKYKLINPQFTPFPEEMLLGRTKYCSKGVFQFEATSGENRFATIFATHLQHSEEPEYPTIEEIQARSEQMNLIVEKVQRVKDGAVVVTGDLNLDDDEYNQASWKGLFEKDESATRKTWGGDGFCAYLVGNKRASNPLNLDHTLLVKGSAQSIHSTIVETGFDGAVYNPKALSDHEGILSKVALHRIKASQEAPEVPLSLADRYVARLSAEAA